MIAILLYLIRIYKIGHRKENKEPKEEKEGEQDHIVHLVKKKKIGNKTKNQVSLICLQINSSKHKNKQKIVEDHQ